MIRQDDILIVPLTRRDSAWYRLPKVEIQGAALWGAHRVEGDLVQVFDTQRHGRVIHAREDFQVTHGEHAVALRAGSYQVIPSTPTR